MKFKPPSILWNYKTKSMRIEEQAEQKQGTLTITNHRIHYATHDWDAKKKWTFFVEIILQVLRGNSNTYLVARQKLDLPFVASRVRFVPYSQHPRTVCMRVEIFGCVWERKLIYLFIYHYKNFAKRNNIVIILDEYLWKILSIHFTRLKSSFDGYKVHF